MDPITLQDGTQLDPKVVKVMRAIRQVESGGDYNAVGDNGESHGAYQWNKDHFKVAAKQYLGDENAPMTPANQNKVAYSQMKKYKDEGRQPEEIAALWKDMATGTYAYNKPEYGEKFRQALLGSQGVGAASQPQVEYKPTYAPPQDATQPTKEDGLGSELKSRAQYAGQGLLDAASGKINPLSGLSHVAGAIGGAIGDVAGSALGAITPDFIKKPLTAAVQKGAGAVMNTGVGQAVMKGAEGFSQAHPELSADIGDIGNVAMAVPVLKGVGMAKTAVSGALGKAMGKTALSGTIDAISPELSGKAASGAVARGGIKSDFLTGTYKQATPKALEDMAKVVQESVPGFDSMKTFTEKLNATRTSVYKMAEDLKQQVVKSGQDTMYSYRELEAQMKALEPSIAVKSDNTLSRQFELAREAAMKTAVEAGSTHPLGAGGIGVISDLFDARKAFDAIVDKQFPNLYLRENAPMRDAITSMREVMNNFIDERLPKGSGFRESLKNQSKLFRAIDNMAPKAAKELGSTRMSRFSARHPKTIGTLKTGGKLVAEGIGLGAAFGGTNYLMNR